MRLIQFIVMTTLLFFLLIIAWPLFVGLFLILLFYWGYFMIRVRSIAKRAMEDYETTQDQMTPKIHGDVIEAEYNEKEEEIV